MIENTIFNYLCYVVQTFKKTKKKRNILPTQKKINVTVVSGGIQKKKVLMTNYPTFRND